ncbi:hypothetical protein [Pseudomonas sp. JBR1]|nr:hypothetical protein [Pseudomonas sp. JBR1]WCE07875.1 hypothetical protein PJ259_18500 [Pseudomonas sp. JBR1]
MSNTWSHGRIQVVTALLKTPLLAQGKLPEAVRVPADSSLMLGTGQ